MEGSRFPPPPTHPLARSGKWLPRATGRRTLSAPSLTVSRSTSSATSRSPRGSSTRLSCAAPSGSHQLASSRKASNPKPGSSVAGLVDQQPPQMLRPRGSAARSPPPPSPPRHRPGSRTAPAAARPAAAPPARATSLGTSRSSAWPRRARIGDRLGQAEGGARRRLARRRGERFGLAPEHPVERVERIVRLAKPPRQAPPRHPGELADGLEAEQFERPRRARGQAQRGDGEGGEEVVLVPLPLGEREARRSVGG